MWTKSKRLKICDADDIAKVIKYEQSLGYDRRTGIQLKKKEYEVKYKVLWSSTDSVFVDAFSEDEACGMVEDIVYKSGEDYDDIEFISITEI